MIAATQAARNAKPRRPRRQRLAIAIGLVLVTVGVPTGFWFWSTWANERELAEALAETERLDPRWRFEDILADRKPIADEDNPAIVVGKVTALLRQGKFDAHEKNWERLDDLPSARRLNDPQIAVLREALTKHAEAVELGRTLKDFESEGRFALTIDPDFIGILVEPVQRCRDVVCLLQGDAMLRAEDGDVVGALQSCRALLGAARAVGEEPFLIAALIRFAGEHRLVNALERTLAQGEPPVRELKDLQELVAKEIDATFFLQAMRGERGLSDAWLGALRRGKVNASELLGRVGGGVSLQDRLVDAFPGTILRGQPELLRLMNQAVEAARLPPEKQGLAFELVDKAAHASGAPLVQRCIQDVQKRSLNSRRAQANLRCALVGIAAERYRIDRGQWPASLAELAKDGWIAAVPLDPFDGQPLRFTVVANGVLIYSVGFDGVDDGGRINRDYLAAPGTDLGFRLWNVEFRRPAPLPPQPDD